MFTQKCPKCGSSQIRKGYKRTPLPMRLVGSITFYAIIATYFLPVLRCPEASAVVKSIDDKKLRNGILNCRSFPLDKAELL